VSIRARDIPASAQMETADGVIPIVTQEDLIRAMTDAAVVLDLSGGCVSVVVQRVPSGVPNEMFTSRAILTWQDRTNAKPQPEQTATLPQAEPVADSSTSDEAVPRPVDPTPFDDGLRVDPNAVDDSDEEMQAALR
jgi:hypothetical protein